ncbi:spore germination protein [Neobacillus sp. MM2021_6]|uniref:spore germination protein n=1 Tax=Bacillaceae TaxID=186817 RepID=UPI00140A5410|nr:MULTISPECIES: spore germination protein [Bacillaceae]MBO0960869.1 spore germination protein [Neobacillus sp. MM2021_6]
MRHRKKAFMESQPPLKRTNETFISLPPLNTQALREIFSKCPDIEFSTFKFKLHPVTFIYCSGLINTDLLYETIPSLIEKFFERFNGTLTTDVILEELNLPSIATISSEENVVSDIFAGKLLIDFGISGILFTLDIAKRPQREPSETNTESTILGPRDDFIEDININVSLIRKRLRTTSLVFEEFCVGKRTKTKLLLLYIDDIANLDTLGQIRNKLSSINVDGLSSTNQLEELINNNKYALFPRHKYTGKPEFAVQTLLSGRFVILIDGVATAFITPINFHLLFKTNEDKEISYIYVSLERLLRVSGLLISTLFPGIWIALTTFHQDQVPLSLLATVVETRRGVPFPAAVEAFAMLLLFELFREAGVRLPMAIGQILSVVGGLIIGDAAISSGLTSPSMLVVIALSTVATFTLVDQSLIGTLSIIRFLSIIMASLLGFFGVLLSFFLLLSYLGSIQTFGVYYLDGMNQFNKWTFLKTFFKLPAGAMRRRPEDLNLTDDTRKGE